MFIGLKRGLSDAKRWFRKSDLCLRDYGGKTVATSPPQPANPKTESQTASRDSMRLAAEAWRALPESARAAWGAYAEMYGEVIADQMYKDLCGWDVFLPAWRNSSLSGAMPPEAPLDQSPPSAVISVEEVATDSDGTFSFRIGHGLAPEGCGLLVRMTHATATRARRPYSRQARLIAGHTPESLLPLPANGGIVTFTAPQFKIAQGQRFGLALRVVRFADGIHSREFFADLYRGGSETLPETGGGEGVDGAPAAQAMPLYAENVTAASGQMARTERKGNGQATMRLEDYTSDVICQAMELPAFVEEHWRESAAPTLRLLLTPSFHPELCITVQVLNQGALIQVRALKDMLWKEMLRRTEAAREHSRIFMEEALITSEPDVQELLSLSSQALSAPPRSGWISIDGMGATLWMMSPSSRFHRKF